MRNLSSQISPPATNTRLQRIELFFGASLFAAGSKFAIYNPYFPGRQHTICRLFHTFQPASDAITCGNFNSHHRMWYGHQAGQRQKQLSGGSGLADALVERIVGLALDLQNTPGEYTHFPATAQTPQSWTPNSPEDSPAEMYWTGPWARTLARAT